MKCDKSPLFEIESNSFKAKAKIKQRLKTAPFFVAEKRSSCCLNRFRNDEKQQLKGGELS